MQKQIATLMIACLAGCGIEDHYGDVLPPQAPVGIDQRVRLDFQSVYRAVFRQRLLECCYSDELHDNPEPLAVGRAGIVGATESRYYAQDSDAIGLIVTKPPTSPPQAQTASVGLFIQHLDYGPGTAFIIRATFRRPDGPHLPVDAQNAELTNAWAVGVQARTGGLIDAEGLNRLTVTFRVRNTGAVLNVQGINETLDPATIKVDPSTYAAIFDADQPFTIELLVDRRDGSGKATLTAGSYPTTTVPFTMSYFKKDNGDPITIAGATLANCCAPGQTARVEVKAVQLLALRPVF